MMIKHHKIYQDDIDWKRLIDYVKDLQKLMKEFEVGGDYIQMMKIFHELESWFEWLEIHQNFHDTDWAVDPVEGRVW